MSSSPGRSRGTLVVRGAQAVAAVCLGLAAAFFAYYTLRLFYVTRFFLSATRPHETGMYIGAAVFPVATLVLGFLSWRCLAPLVRGKRRQPQQPRHP